MVSGTWNVQATQKYITSFDARRLAKLPGHRYFLNYVSISVSDVPTTCPLSVYEVRGGYDKEEKAARAYDLAALKYWGPTTNTNFLVTDYEKELVEMKNMTRQEFIASLRRKSNGFSRGASIYRGVTRHHQHGRWQARIGRVAGNKDLYLGTFSTQEEAAEAYDIAAIKFRGLNAVTNFDMSRYDIKSIANSNLPIGGITKSKNSDPTISDSKTISDDSASNSNLFLCYFLSKS
ncbi:hypothetical protein ACFE04_020458 [Oxalis oulophora]